MSILASPVTEPGANPAAAVSSALASVLVIDDEEIVGNTISALLQAEGFDVATARSGKEGVELLCRRQFEVVITDLVMPGMNGTQTTAALKEIDPDIQVIILTGYATAESAIAALRQGAGDFLLKPIGMAQLRPALLRALAKRRDEVARAEARAGAVIATAQEVIILFDGEGRVRDFNPMAERIFGWSHDEVVGRNLLDFAIPPRHHKGFRMHLQAVCREGKDPLEGCLEVYALRRNGEEFPFEISTAVIDTPQGKLLSTFGRDITERKAAQKAVQESEAKLEAIFDGVETGIFLIDPETHRILEANPLALELVGAPRELIVGAKCHRFVCPAGEGHCPVTDLGKQVDNSERILLTVTGTQLPIIKTVRPVVIAGRQLLLESFVDISARKRAAEALRESEDRYRDLVENSFVLIGTHDAKGRILGLNRAATCLLEAANAEKMAGRPLTDYVPPDLLPRFDEYLKTILHQGHAEGLMLLATPSGKVKIVEYRNTLRRQGQEEPIVRWVGQDVTERIQAEKAQAFLATLVESSQDAIIGFNLEGGILSWNHGAQELYGYRAEEVIGKYATVIIPPEFQGEIQQQRKKILGGEMVPAYESVRVRKDGSRVDVALTVAPVYDTAGTITGAVSIAHDITRRKRAEEQTRLQTAAVESAHNGIVITDREGRIIWANPAFARLSGYPTEEVLGQTPRALKSGKHEAAFYEGLWQTILSGEVWQGEIVNRRKDGALYTEEMTITPVRDRSGAITHFIAIKQDISVRKRAEELHIAKEAAETASRVKSQFLASMSHEIRTPINGVIGMTKVLLDSELSAEQRRYAQVACTCGETLLALINDILDFSKIEAHKLSLEVIDFDLRAMLEHTVEILATPASEKGLELTCLVAPETPSFVRGDPARLRQILLNLVGNAVKFTHQGEVAIRGRLDHEDGDTVTLRFAVEDTGIGIPKDRVGALFSPFVQADGSTTRKYGGTGLGLAISKQLAELMGGQIGVESEEGKGSTFWFTVVQQNQEAQGTQVADAPSEFEGVKVLVADDNATNRLVVGTLLKSWGCRISQAPNGNSALATLRKAARLAEPFDVAVLDMEMPGMDGKELGRQIAADAQLSRTALLMMTSPLRGQKEACSGERSLVSYITKPVMESHLRDALSVTLGRKKPANDSAGGKGLKHLTSTPARAGARLLVAEDIASNREVALAILNKLGYHADLVTNGAEALIALQSVSYDLVLMDCEMPEMDGYEATRRIRRQETLAGSARIPIIALTAHAISGDKAVCIEAGMDDYLSKPIEPQELAGALVKWLPTSPPPGEPEAPGTPPRPAANGIFNPEELLGRLMGDRALAEKIVAGFLQDAPVQLCHLRERLEAGDAVESRRLAHGLKGAAATVSAAALRDVALQAENAARAGDLERVGQVLPSLNEKFEQLRAALREAAWA